MSDTHNTTPEQTQQRVISARAKRKGQKEVEKRSQQLERLEVEYVPIGSIQPNDYNPNRQSDHQFQLLLNSIEDNGFTQPLIVNRDGIIVDGEHRWRAATVFGLDAVPVVRVDMSPEQMRIATIQQNTARGDHDIQLEVQLLRDLESLGALDWAQDSLLIGDDELAKLLEDVPAPEALADEDFSQSWEPDSVYDDKDSDFINQSDTATQHIESTQGALVRSMTPETLDRVREREAAIQQAKTEQERESAKDDKAFYRLSLVFHGDEAELVKTTLGKEPASKVVAMCRDAS